MAILLLGSGGFVGKNIQSELQKNPKRTVVGILSRHSADWQNLWQRLADGEFQAVVNAAGHRYRHPENAHIDALFDINALLPQRLAIACARGSTALIHLSSRWALGERGEGPNTAYGASKALGDAHVLRTLGAAGVDHAVVRIRETFGLYDPRSSLIGNLTQSSLQQSTLELSPGQQFVDPLDMTELATSIAHYVDELLEQKAPSGVFETPCHPTTVLDVVDEWRNAVAPNLKVQVGARPYLGSELFALEQVHAPLPALEFSGRELAFTRLWQKLGDSHDDSSKT